MRDNDGRKLDHKTLEALRIRAVDQVGESAHPEDVAAALGLHRKTVYGCWRNTMRRQGCFAGPAGATSGEAIFDLDFHAVMHGGRDPALGKRYVPKRSQRARSVLTFFVQDSGTHNLVYASADTSKATQAREVIAFCDYWKAASGHDPQMLVMDQKVTTQQVLGELDARGVKFLTLRMRSPAPHQAIRPADDHRTAARRDHPRLYAGALSSTVNLNVDLDIMLAVLAQALLAALRARLPGYAAVTPDVIQRRFLETPGQIITTSSQITVRLERRAYSPVLRKARLPATTIPWWGNRILHYEFT